MTLTCSPLLLFLSLVAGETPVPKLPVGKATTYVTGPIDKDGCIDYETALNERLGKGITPDKNANVLLWKALGPRPEGSNRMPAKFFKQLGIEEPPEQGDYFVGLDRYMKNYLKLATSEFDAIYEQEGRAKRRPWAAKDYPHIAAWLILNEKPLAESMSVIFVIPRSREAAGGAFFEGVMSCLKWKRPSDLWSVVPYIETGDGEPPPPRDPEPPVFTSNADALAAALNDTPKRLDCTDLWTGVWCATKQDGGQSRGKRHVIVLSSTEEGRIAGHGAMIEPLDARAQVDRLIHRVAQHRVVSDNPQRADHYQKHSQERAAAQGQPVRGISGQRFEPARTRRPSRGASRSP